MDKKEDCPYVRRSCPRGYKKRELQRIALKCGIPIHGKIQGTRRYLQSRYQLCTKLIKRQEKFFLKV